MNTSHTTGLALWAYPFRPFFLAVGIYGVVMMMAWLAFWFGGWPLPETISPLHWHSHEVLFGLVTAAIAGFLLTAMCTWTGASPLNGAGLIGLCVLWLAGRAAMWSAGFIPGWLVAAVNLAFLPAMALYAGRVIVAAGNHRNLILVAALVALAVCHLLFFTGLLTGQLNLVRQGELAAILLIVMLMTIVGGRITPAFTRNWLVRRGGDSGRIRSRGWVEAGTLSTTAVLFFLLLAGAPVFPVSVLALLAAAFHLLRAIGWSGWLTLSDPLVWILHVGYLFIPLGLLLMSLSPWLDLVTDSSWVHALGTGAMGTLIVGVMTRVALGHTGRQLRLPTVAVGAYLFIILAALARVGAGLGLVSYQAGLVVAGAAWIGAFAVFLLAYARILLSPRADGRPG